MCFFCPAWSKGGGEFRAIYSQGRLRLIFFKNPFMKHTRPRGRGTMNKPLPPGKSSRRGVWEVVKGPCPIKAVTSQLSEGTGSWVAGKTHVKNSVKNVWVEARNLIILVSSLRLIIFFNRAHHPLLNPGLDVSKPSSTF